MADTPSAECPECGLTYAGGDVVCSGCGAERPAAGAASGFELVEESAPPAPAAMPPSEPEPEPPAGDAAPEPEPDDVPTIELTDDPPPEPEAPAEEFTEESGPSDGHTVRMALSDVVSAWDEDAADAGDDDPSGDAPTAKDRGGLKRIVVAILVIAFVLAAIIVILGSCAAPAQAAEAAAGNTLAVQPSDIPVSFEGSTPVLERPKDCCWRPWELSITPYGFLASVDGDVWVDTEKESISIPFEDIIKRTTAGGMLNVTFGYKRWFVALDGIYGRIEDDFDVGTTNIDVRINQYQLDIMAGWRVCGRSFGRWVGARCCPPPVEQAQTFDVFVGMRYIRTETRLRIQRPAGIILPAVDTHGSDTQAYWEPFVGRHLGAPPDRQVDAALQGQHRRLRRRWRRLESRLDARGHRRLEVRPPLAPLLRLAPVRPGPHPRVRREQGRHQPRPARSPDRRGPAHLAPARSLHSRQQVTVTFVLG